MSLDAPAFAVAAMAVGQSGHPISLITVAGAVQD
jgi:hypothetical protein